MNLKRLGKAILHTLALVVVLGLFTGAMALLHRLVPTAEHIAVGFAFLVILFVITGLFYIEMED